MNKNLKIGLLVTGGILAVGTFAYFTFKYMALWSLDLEQQKYVNELHPKVKGDFARFIKEVKDKLGYNVIVTDGYRTFAESVALKQQDPRNATAGLSEHNYGMALDLVLEKGGTILHKADSEQAWLNTGVPQLAKDKYGMRWGGDFSGYPDHVHFDYANKYPASHLRELAIQQFGSDETQIRGNKVRLS